MTYRVVATEIIDDTDRVVFDALDNKVIRRELCRRWNEAEAAEAERDELRRQLAEAQRENERLHAELVKVNQQNAQALINSIRGDA